MHVQEIQKKLKAQPFVPFRIVTSGSDRYRVDHPENVILTRTSVIVAHSGEKGLGAVHDDYVVISYLHIAALEPVPPRNSSRKTA